MANARTALGRPIDEQRTLLHAQLLFYGGLIQPVRGNPAAGLRDARRAVEVGHTTGQQCLLATAELAVGGALIALGRIGLFRSWYLDYLTTIAKWLADHGVDYAAAAGYTRQIFGQLGQSLLQRTDSLTALTDKHMTPGGINEQLMTDLRRDGVPDVVRRALDRILARLREQLAQP